MVGHEYTEWLVGQPNDYLSAFDWAKRASKICGMCGEPQLAGVHLRAALPTSVQATQVGGDHYVKHAIQPWHIIDEYDLTFYEGNVVKYLLRQKGDRLTDLKKARHYLDKQIEIEEEKKSAD